ncbi:MAG TPA: M23 family metallopeptidase [Candidatus Dormibacteraeota bacterium]|nr:M23 family metallopeptidase [Candidatus Dormibacteraeota bacterium]
MVLLRVLAVVIGVAVVWTVGASRVPDQMKVPVMSVVPGAQVTQPFGCSTLELEPTAYWCPFHHFHSGIDLAAPQGTEVYTATSGRAVLGYDPSGAGNYIAIQFDRHVRVLYCHLAAFRIQPGAQVQPGQLIGIVGATGLATGPHVHLEVQVDGLPVDPAAWLGS